MMQPFECWSYSDEKSAFYHAADHAAAASSYLDDCIEHMEPDVVRYMVGIYVRRQDEKTPRLFTGRALRTIRAWVIDESDPTVEMPPLKNYTCWHAESKDAKSYTAHNEEAAARCFLSDHIGVRKVFVRSEERTVAFKCILFSSHYQLSGPEVV